VEQRHVWTTTRRIKPGALDEFQRAWRPEARPAGLEAAFAFWSDDGRQVTGVSLWDTKDSCDAWRASEAELHRRQAMADLVQDEQESFYDGVEFTVPSG
jgi:heme-degrading monooxygenase HmoA